MIPNLWSRKAVVLATVVVTCACLVAFVAFSLASPEQVSSAALGPDWQCSRVAFVLTTCSRVDNVATGAIQVRAKDVPAKEDCPEP
ncbi:hypothetical protein UP10_14640 [Bradyrhizobium sp. LTSPM299]|uniref:hypothetical protein n=1 Tax=Bradyrhizobium sp. LTSPM299 TaxID=1619233 RepID=UPI0005CA91FA|nr:hypothetical protein [Bradyrhizobium sp. LTSPM299]KJC59926.1 hypothetical protein UP10_14640 [Bradyrhizobium sp. LTSPM299]